MSIIPDLKVVAVQMAGFVLVLIVFKLFLFKPILSILDARKREIDSQYEMAEADRKAAEEVRTKYEQQLVGAQDEIRTNIAEALRQGQAMREEIITESRTKAESMLAKAQEDIRRETEKALVELKGTVADIVVNATEKLIEEKLDPDKHRALVSKYIDQLDEVAR